MQKPFSKPDCRNSDGICNICQRKFPTAYSLGMHKVKMHIKQIKCESANSYDCIMLNNDQETSTDTILNAAIPSNNSHTSFIDKELNMNGKFQCQLCKMYFKNLANHRKCPKVGANVVQHRL